ncbi:MAG TPA: DUF4085 family protein [Humisphaera sp.]|nr:DUF4085 family protein [Humisphaera sp.]
MGRAKPSLMMFFTPRLIHRMRSDRFDASELVSVLDSYRAHVAAIRHALTPSARRLSGLSFHDCVIQRVEFASPDTVVIDLHGFKNFLTGRKAHSGLHRLTFKTVDETNISLHHLSRYWSYEEIHWMGQAAEVRVILDDGEQFHIQFQNLKVQKLNSRLRRVRLGGRVVTKRGVERNASAKADPTEDHVEN